MAIDDPRLETVQKLSLQHGDILHVRIGGEIGSQPFVPTRDDILYIKSLWDQVLPEGVRAVFTHHLVDETVIQPAIHCTTWPPKVGKVDVN